MTWRKEAEAAVAVVRQRRMWVIVLIWVAVLVGAFIAAAVFADDKTPGTSAATDTTCATGSRGCFQGTRGTWDKVSGGSARSPR
jgi:hypothetical protein